MAQINFLHKKVTLSSGDKTIYGQGSVTFDTNVISAGGAIQQWDVDFKDGQNNINYVGASVYNVQHSGTTVTFQVSLTLSPDKGHPIEGTVTALIIAYCE